MVCWLIHNVKANSLVVICPSPGDPHHLSHRSELPPRQSVQTASQPGGGTHGSLLIQVELAVGHGQTAGRSPGTADFEGTI